MDEIHIFLAGGKSTRFNENKALYKFADGQTMLEKVMKPYWNDNCYIFAHESIAEAVRGLNIPQCHQIVANGNTDTSVITAVQGINVMLVSGHKHIHSETHVTFHDCDVLTDRISCMTSIVQYGLESYGKIDDCYFAGSYYFGVLRELLPFLGEHIDKNIPDAFLEWYPKKIVMCNKFFPFNTPAELEISNKLLELYKDKSDTICVDVDGTLIDNNNLIVESYKEAGIDQYTPGRPVECSAEAREIKQERYKERISNRELTAKEIILQLILVNNYNHIVLATCMSAESLSITAPLFLDKFMNNENTSIVLQDKGKAILSIPNCAYYIGDSETDGKYANFMKKKWLKWEW